MKNACLLALVETAALWMGPKCWSQIDGIWMSYKHVCSAKQTGKSCGGGLCFYLNQRYCNTVVFWEKICTPDIELLTISCHPFYLPQEFQQLLLPLVHIHPRANATAAAQLSWILLVQKHPSLFWVNSFTVVWKKCWKIQAIRDVSHNITEYKTGPLLWFSMGLMHQSLCLASYHNSVFLLLVYTTHYLGNFSRRKRQLKSGMKKSISILQASVKFWKTGIVLQMHVGTLLNLMILCNLTSHSV